ncbi:AP-1-like transcription factor [Parachaetomium inaequale]|uniref:AP-1-like transcription factor n=1 Tax=Parachaetomium inaequale TaxID=2588326 RepID=A0AAN6PDF3_9PEZI|nr:AP-1-like transcription factor [Parachaetomium inaequale]
MASPSFSANTATDAPNPDHARSTLHAYEYSPRPPPALGRKRSYGGPPSLPGGDGDRDAVTGRDAQPGAVGPGHGHGHGSPSASAPQEAEADDGHTPSSTDGGATSKKRKTGRGSRGVAHLTPEQLERKRANDRDAQRAIRERQRLRTEQYEREIADLKSTQPYRELQSVVRQKEAVEAELADVKRRLAAIMAMIQPVFGAPDGAAMSTTAPAYPAPGLSHAPTQPSTAPTTRNPGSTPTSATSPMSVGTHGRWQNSQSPVAPTVSIDGQQPQLSPEAGLLDQQRYDLVHGLDLGPDRLGLDFLVDPNLKIARIKNGIDGAQDSPDYRHVPMKHDWSGTISNLPGMQGQPQTQPPSQSPIYTPPSVTSSGPFSPTAAAATTINRPSTRGPPPIYTLVPRNCAPTCPLDSLLLDFLSERRQRAAEGLSQSEILGPRYPSVSSLLNPAVSVYSHPLSKVFTDILARFPNLSALPERVAVLYAMFLLMRWQVAPTQENYLRLPAWFRPVRQQAEKEHPAWFDHIPFPKMRERLVSGYEEGGFPFDNFFIPFTSTLSINWPYEDAYVLLASPTGDELMINPVFEQHLAVLANWTLGPAFERAFPGLAGCFNLKRGD